MADEYKTKSIFGFDAVFRQNGYILHNWKSNLRLTSSRLSNLAEI